MSLRPRPTSSVVRAVTDRQPDVSQLPSLGALNGLPATDAAEPPKRKAFKRQRALEGGRVVAGRVARRPGGRAAGWPSGRAAPPPPLSKRGGGRRPRVRPARFSVQVASPQETKACRYVPCMCRAARCMCKELGSGFAVRWMQTPSMVMPTLSECFFLAIECALHVNSFWSVQLLLHGVSGLLFALPYCTCAFEMSSHDIVWPTRATFDCFRHHSSMLFV